MYLAYCPASLGTFCTVASLAQLRFLLARDRVAGSAAQLDRLWAFVVGGDTDLPGKRIGVFVPGKCCGTREHNEKGQTDGNVVFHLKHIILPPLEPKIAAVRVNYQIATMILLNLGTLTTPDDSIIFC
jgi:hypothetical protein